MCDHLLSVKDLEVTFHTESGRIPAVRGVSFDLGRGEILCLVGESGCGKSVTALALLGLTDYTGGVIECGSIHFNGRDVMTMSESEVQRIRGNQISMIFQEPMTSLNPLFSIGFQMTETMRLHLGLSREQARMRAVELLKKVDIPAPEMRLDDYPQKLSGGMRQRVMIAMAISGEPQLLVADEPTTALDVTVQVQILNILKEMGRELNLSVLLITHDMGIVAEVADRVAVMYAGRIVELASVDEIFERPLHPYTQGLLASLPKGSGLRSERLKAIMGTVPKPQELPPGCAFNPRCEQSGDICIMQDSQLAEVYPEHGVSCHMVKKI